MYCLHQILIKLLNVGHDGTPPSPNMWHPGFHLNLILGRRVAWSTRVLGQALSLQALHGEVGHSLRGSGAQTRTWRSGPARRSPAFFCEQSLT